MFKLQAKITVQDFELHFNSFGKFMIEVQANIIKSQVNLYL